jgi:hypothetical protein
MYGVLEITSNGALNDAATVLHLAMTIFAKSITGKRVIHLRVDFCDDGALPEVPRILSRAFWKEY